VLRAKAVRASGVHMQEDGASLEAGNGQDATVATAGMLIPVGRLKNALGRG